MRSPSMVRGHECQRYITWPVRVLATLREVLCEIFDEAAYSRFLSRTRKGRSRESYAEFLRENEQAKARRPRCC